MFWGVGGGGVFSKPSILLLPGQEEEVTLFSFCCQGQEEEVTFFSFCCPVQNFPGTARTDGQTLLPLYIRWVVLPKFFFFCAVLNNFH